MFPSMDTQQLSFLKEKKMAQIKQNSMDKETSIPF